MITKRINFFKLQALLLSVMSLLFTSGCIHKGPNKAKKQKPIQQKKVAKKAGKKYFRDLDYDDHKKIKNRLLTEGRKESAIKHIEKMIPLCNSIQEIRDLTLEIADLFFETGDLKKAESLYSSFGELYPGDRNIEYATYKSILCCYWLTLDTERDQSKTRDAIERSKNFLTRSDIFHKYNDKVSEILVDCQSKLLESEVKVFKFYINRGDLLSAKTRLANMEKEFLKDMPSAEPKLIMLACEFAEKINDKELLEKKQEELKTKFPNHKEETIVVAKNKKPSFLNKF